MANIRTASKVGTIYYDLYDGEGFIVLNDRWFVLLPDICELDVLQDLIADLTEMYDDVHAETFSEVDPD
jgi:hypothetical protein